MTTSLVISGLIGLVFGFNISPMPRGAAGFGFAIKFVLAFVTAVVGTFLLRLAGLGGNTPGIDWTALIVDIVVGYLLALAVVSAAARLAT